MGTDAKIIIELLDVPATYKSPYLWATIHIRRDYLLFNLIAAGRSDDPNDSVFPIKKLKHEEFGEVAWLWASELEAIADVYLKKNYEE